MITSKEEENGLGARALQREGIYGNHFILYFNYDYSRSFVSAWRVLTPYHQHHPLSSAFFHLPYYGRDDGNVSLLNLFAIVDAIIVHLYRFSVCDKRQPRAPTTYQSTRYAIGWAKCEQWTSTNNHKYDIQFCLSDVQTPMNRTIEVT